MHLRLEIFVTFSVGFGVFEAHFLIKKFLFLKKNVLIVVISSIIDLLGIKKIPCVILLFLHF